MPLFQTVFFLAVSNAALPLQTNTNALGDAGLPAAYLGIDLNGNTYLSIDPYAPATGDELCSQSEDNSSLNAEPNVEIPATAVASSATKRSIVTSRQTLNPTKSPHPMLRPIIAD